MARLLGAIPDDIAVTCVTRWRPDEIAAGVSDLEVFDLIRARASGTLLLQPHLHAKLYRTGDRRLLGSANISGRALGWHEPANLEILLAEAGLNSSAEHRVGKECVTPCRSRCAPYLAKKKELLYSIIIISI